MMAFLPSLYKHSGGYGWEKQTGGEKFEAVQEKKERVGQLTKVMQIGIHLLVTDNGKYLIILKLNAFVLFKDGLAVLVQFNAKAVFWVLFNFGLKVS